LLEQKLIETMSLEIEMQGLTLTNVMVIADEVRRTFPVYLSLCFKL